MSTNATPRSRRNPQAGRRDDTVSRHRRAPLRKVDGQPGLYYREGTVPPNYWACATPSGSRTPAWKQLGTIPKEAARDELGTFRAEVRKGRPPTSRQEHAARNAPARSTATPTFAQVGEILMADLSRRVHAGEASKKTYEQHDTNLRHHCALLNDERIDVIDDNLLEVWLEQESLKPQWTRKNHWSTVRAVLQTARRKKLIAVNPADLVDRELLPKQEYDPRWLTRAELDRLIDAAQCDFDEDCMLILSGTGLRQGECRALLANSVDEADGAVLVRSQLTRDNERKRLKTRRGRRDIYAGKVVIERLLRRADLVPEGTPLMAVRGRLAVSPSRLAEGIAKAAAAAGLQDVTCHTLRHTFASMLIMHGASAAYVADQLGHASPEITYRIYAHVFDRAREAKHARKGLDAEFRRFRLPGRG